VAVKDLISKMHNSKTKGKQQNEKMGRRSKYFSKEMQISKRNWKRGST
jgi:hypothetical protein